MLLALAAFVAWMLWPAAEPPPEVVAVEAPHGQQPEPETKPKPTVKPAARKPPPKLAAASLVHTGYSPDREKLLQAIRERSRDLAACALPPGSPPMLPTRLRISRAGEVRALRFSNGGPLPEALSTCARSKINAWKFADLALQSDVEILVSFELGKP